MTYGVTSTGFVVKDLQTIKSELEADYKASFGEDLDVNADSIAGQFIGNQAKKLADMWELMETVYNYFNPDKASGESLDGAAGLVAVIRLPASSSESVVALYGNLGTIISAGHLMEQVDTGEQFALEDAVTISLSNVVDIDFSVTNVLNNTIYTVTINGTPITYTSDATATAAEIIAGLTAAIDGSAEPVNATDNYSIDGTCNVQANDGKTSFSIVVDSNLQVDKQASPGNYIALNTGIITVPQNTINIIVVPIAGLDEAYNLVAGITGRETETDEQLRVRRRRDLRGVGRATDEAILARILQEVDNVTAVTVISNRTDVIVSGRPPHSFECVVVGGDEDEIAEKIWENQPSGIQSHGDITKTVKDSQGTDQTIKFSRPINKYLWLEIDITLYTEEDFPSNGIDLIKQAITEWGEEEYQVGVDVIRQRINIPIYTVPGVEDIDIEMAVTNDLTPPGSYSPNNIAIADDEIALADSTRITVTII